MNGQMNGQVHNHMNGYINGQVNNHVENQIDHQMDNQRDNQLDVEMENVMDLQIGDRINDEIDDEVEGEMDNEMNDVPRYPNRHVNMRLFELEMKLANVKLDELVKKLPQYFKEVDVRIVSCPCLSREPYNLSGVGLCGPNRKIFKCGSMYYLRPLAYTNSKYDIRDILSQHCFDTFVIGTGYTAKPHMPHNGHLIVDATYRTPSQYTNKSRIVYIQENNGQPKIEIMNKHDQMKCSFVSNLFVTDGLPGLVLKVRVKGDKYKFNILSAIQKILFKELYVKTKRVIGLGGVLMIKNGKVIHSVLRRNFPPEFSTFREFATWFRWSCTDYKSELIAVGTIVNNTPPMFNDEIQRYGYNFPVHREGFNFFSKDEVGGEFIGDVTPDTTEYIGYFNTANEIQYIH